MPTYITSTVANDSGFNPSIWAQEALPILRNNLTLTKAVSKDSDWGENAFATVGQTLNIGYAGTFSAQDKSANTLLTASVPTGGAQKSVSLSKYKVVPFVVENIAQAQSNQNLMQRYLEPAVVALAEQVESDLFSAAYGLSAASLGTIGSDLDSSALRGAAKNLNSAKAPQADRHFLLSPKDLAALEADSNLSNYFAYNSVNGVIENGVPARPLYGFNLHMSQLTPATSGSGHAVQTITITGTSGSFTITYSGQTTGSIAYGSSAASVESKLQALSTIGTGNARVSYDSGSKKYTIVLYVDSPVAFTTTDTTLTTAVADSTMVATSNLYFHKNALVLASRPVRPAGGSTVMSAQIVDEESGLVLNMEAQYNIQAMGLWVNLSILYGVAAIRPDQGGFVLA